MAESLILSGFPGVARGFDPPSLIKKSQYLEGSGSEAFFVVKGSAVGIQDEKKKPKERDSVIYLLCLLEHSDLLISDVLSQ